MGRVRASTWPGRAATAPAWRSCVSPSPRRHTSDCPGPNQVVHAKLGQERPSGGGPSVSGAVSAVLIGIPGRHHRAERARTNKNHHGRASLPPPPLHAAPRRSPTRRRRLSGDRDRRPARSQSARRRIGIYRRPAACGRLLTWRRCTPSLARRRTGPPRDRRSRPPCNSGANNAEARFDQCV